MAIVPSLGFNLAIANAASQNTPSSSSTIQAFSIEHSAPIVKAGDAASSKFIINRDFVDPDNNCEFCTAMIYNPGIKHEAGVAYKDTKINFGDAKRLVFFAKGQV